MKNKYGIGEIIKNTVSYLYTKLFYNKARLIRLPIFVRGKKFLKYGSGFTTGYNCRIEMFEISKKNQNKIIIGDNFRMGDFVHIAAGEQVKFGDNCLLASKIYISDISHGDYSSIRSETSPDIPPHERELSTKPVIVGNNVWIGEGVSILPGACIGDGSIIGANSVVTKKIPDNCIAVGSPAKVIKIYDKKEKVWKRV